MIKVAINGLGRIGRATLKIALDTPELDVVAANDIAPAENLAYLLLYDSVYGRYGKEVKMGDSTLSIEGNDIPLFAEKDPAQLPWDKMGVDLVFECTGVLRRTAELDKHLQAGAKHVVLSAPGKDEEMVSVVHGSSTAKRPAVYSCASCTTNCITPVVEVLARRIGVHKAAMTTIHAYTSTQAIVDGPASKMRRGRAAAMNFVPTTTGAAIATTKVLPEIEGKFDGVAVRGPVACGSLADVTLLTKRSTTGEEVNDIYIEESGTARYRGVLGVTPDPFVSSDILKDSRASVVDLEMTKVIDGDLVKVMSWYDNEWGYAAQLVREAQALAKSQAGDQERTDAAASSAAPRS